MKEVIMIHGWGGNNEQGWFLPLKKELEKQKINVINPNMPDTFHPKIDEWVEKIKKITGEVSEDTYFIGHSIGCQAIMRFLGIINKKIGGMVLVAAWLNLTEETWDETYKKEIAKPWIETPIDFNNIKKNCKNILVILSDNDPYVPLKDSKIFKRELNAEIMIIKNREHIEELNNKEIKTIVDFIKNDRKKY